MSRRVKIVVTATFILFMLAAIIAGIFSFQKKNIAQAETPTEIQATQPRKYIIKEYNDMVAVFDKGSGLMVKITDSYVSALPEEDRKNLSKGIVVEDEESLRKLLEDLCS